MNSSRTAFFATAAFAVMASIALGAVAEIPPVGSATDSEGRAITKSPSGEIIVGGFASPTNVTTEPKNWGGLIWDAANGSRNVLSGDTAPAAMDKITGIGYRTVNGNPQLIIHGLSSGWNASLQSNDNGLTWSTKIRDLGWPDANAPHIVGEANTLGTSLSSDAWYVGWTTGVYSGISKLTIDRYTGEPYVRSRNSKDAGNEDPTRVLATSSLGLSVGFRRPKQLDETRPQQIYLGQHPGPDAAGGSWAFFKGLQPVEGVANPVWPTDYTQFGQAWAVSSDSTKVFGVSPNAVGSADLWPFRMVVTPSPTVRPTAVSIRQLPTYPDTAGSTTKGWVYGCSADGNWAVGSNYRGQDRAVLWDLRDANPANWKVYDLTAYFGALGQLGTFSRLSRAYAMLVDGTNIYVTGAGIVPTTAGAYTRGFVVTIPLANFPLPETGACCMAGACTSKFAADCPNIEGQQRWTANTLCVNAACPGACCHANGTCSEFVEASACTGEGDVARPAGSLCATACQGACCDGQKTCETENYGVCPAADFKGVGTTCAVEGLTCGCSSTDHVWADNDKDGDVDQQDFGVFQACYTGSTAGIATGCECFNKVADTVIDEFDDNEFEACITGPGMVGVNPSCNP